MAEMIFFLRPACSRQRTLKKKAGPISETGSYINIPVSDCNFSGAWIPLQEARMLPHPYCCLFRLHAQTESISPYCFDTDLGIVVAQFFPQALDQIVYNAGAGIFLQIPQISQQILTAG